MKLGSFRIGAAVVALVTAPATADAHLINTTLGDFYGGMLHPLSGVEDIVSWFALAVLAALQGPEKARWLLFAFPLSLAAGALLSVFAPALPITPVWSIAVVAVTGLAVAAAVSLPQPAFIGLGIFVGLVHGYHNGQAMTQDTDRVLYISAVAVVGYIFMTLMTGLAIHFRQGGGDWRDIALRASGSWVAAVGIMMIGLQLRAPIAM